MATEEIICSYRCSLNDIIILVRTYMKMFNFIYEISMVLSLQKT